MMTTKIAHDGTETTIAPAGKKFTLAEVQAHVGGYVAMIRLFGKRVMLVDEDGMPKSLPVNNKASQMANTLIVGTALVMDKKLFG